MTPVRVEMLNRSMVEGPERYLRQDLHLLQDEGRRGQRPRHDRISLNTSGGNFIRRVEVYGSENQYDWAKLGVGYLIDQEQGQKVFSRTVIYSTSDFPFLQVRIYPNARDATEDLSLLSASVTFGQYTDGETDSQALRMSDSPPGERIPDGATAVILDMGARNRPVSRLILQPEARAEFVRPVKVYGRNYESNTWRWVADGSIHQVETQRRISIDLNEVPYRYFKAEIYNYDDKPIAISSAAAECVPRYLVFEAGEGQAFVYSGSSLGPPKYDLQRRTDADRIKALKKVRLGDPEPNPNRIPPRWIESWGRVLSIAAVGAVSALVIAVILSMVRRQAKEGN
jgi:hypothetical protein